MVCDKVLISVNNPTDEWNIFNMKNTLSSYLIYVNESYLLCKLPGST